MKQYIIYDLLSRKYLQNICEETEKHIHHKLEDNAKLHSNIRGATYFKEEEAECLIQEINNNINASDVINVGLKTKKTFSPSYLTILKINVIN